MILTAGQEKGLKTALDRYHRGEKYTVISGYAGSGKSTLIRYIVEALPVDEDEIVYATFTGKAAQVLLNKGNKNVTTLHKLLYEFYLRQDGTFSKIPKKEIGYHVVIVDEISMAPKTLMDLLFSHGCYVICLGDPMQLPPIDKNEDNHLLDTPHVFLDEIIRQAEDSEIIRLSMDIRNHKSLNKYNGDTVQILNKNDLTTGMLSWADEILVATNKKRKSINQLVRSNILNRPNDNPCDGDKIICCHNYWDVISTQYQDSLINGTIGYLKNVYSSSFLLPSYLGEDRVYVTLANFETETNDFFKTLPMDTKMIVTGEKAIDNKIAYRLKKSKQTAHLVPYEFTYGYAITCHRSQGSEWDKVLVIEESFPFDEEEHTRWLYTAVTRASQKLVLLQ